jgi:hypothetical protein
MRSIILLHFMKERISFSPMEMIIIVPRELNYFGGFGQVGMRDSNKANKSAGCGEI